MAKTNLGKKPYKRAEAASRNTRGGSHRRTPSVPEKKNYPCKLRIIGGRWRGRRLSVPSADGLRPTPDRVRETLFNWLRPWLPGARCLDLFSGTGALCLEALSQGAGAVVMVELQASVVTNLRQNLKMLRADNAQVVHMDAVGYLQQTPQPFDIVFIDPPFRSDLAGRCAALIDERGWLKPEGLVYLEIPSRMRELALPVSWEVIYSKRAGQVGYHLARKKS